MKRNKVIRTILEFELSERTEWVTAFWAILVFTVINNFAKKVIDFYNSSFFSITLIIAIISLGIGFKTFVSFFTKLNYMAIVRRIMFCLSIGIIFNFCTISGWKLIRSFYLVNNTEIQTFRCPILSLNSQRFNHETVDFLFQGRNRSLKIDLRSVSKLQTEGLEAYCLFIKAKVNRDVIILDNYRVEKCSND